MGARRQPLSVAITTAGSSRETLAYELHQYALKVRSGDIDDPTHLPVIFAASPEDDWSEPSTWAACNPALGHGVKLEYLEREAKRAAEVPGYTNSFLRLHLNVWTSAQTRWLPADAWDEAPPIDIESLAGRRCWAGLDLAMTTDLNALSLVFPLEDGTHAVLPYFWVPDSSPDLGSRGRRDGVNYEAAERLGELEATPGAVVDQARIRNKIRELGDTYQIEEIAVDRWNATETALRLQDDGFRVALFGQGFASMSGPSKKLEELVVSRKLRHGGNTILAAHAHSVEVKTDPAGNIKPCKGQHGTSDRIDGIVSLVMALGRSTQDTSPDYSTTGIRTL